MELVDFCPLLITQHAKRDKNQVDSPRKLLGLLEKRPVGTQVGGLKIKNVHLRSPGFIEGLKVWCPARRENHLATAAQSNADFAADGAGTPDDEDSVVAQELGSCGGDGACVE